MRAPVVLSRERIQGGIAFNRNRAGPESFGAGLAQGAAQVGQDQQRIELAKAKRAAQLASQKSDADAIAAHTQLMEGFRKLNYGDPSAGIKGYLDYQGKEAIDAYGDLENTYNKLKSEIVKGLDPEAQQTFARISRSDDDQFLTRVAKHRGDQQKAYSASVSQSAAESAKINLSETFGDDQFTADNLKNVEFYTRAANQFSDPQTAALAVAKAKSEALTAAITTAVDGGHIELAKRRAKQYDKQIIGKDQGVVDKMLKDGTDLEREQQLTDEIIASHPGDLRSQLAKARKLKGKERDNVVKRIKARDDEVKVDEQTQKQKLIAQADELMGRGISPSDWPTSFKAAIGGATLKTYQDDFDGIPHRTDFAYYDELLALAESDRKAFLQLPVEEMRRKLEPRHFNEVINMREKALKPGTSTNTPLGTSLVRQINNAVEENEIDDKHRGAFERSVNRAIESFQETHGRKPSPVEQGEIIASQTVEVKIKEPGDWYFDSESRGAVVLGDIPERYTDVMIDALGDKFKERDAEKIFEEAMSGLGLVVSEEPTPDQLSFAVRGVQRLYDEGYRNPSAEDVQAAMQLLAKEARANAR